MPAGVRHDFFSDAQFTKHVIFGFGWLVWGVICWLREEGYWRLVDWVLFVDLFLLPLKHQSLAATENKTVTG